MSDEDKQGITTAYYSSVEYLDKNVGLVLDELKKFSLADSTLMIYAGDHGYQRGHNGRFEKHNMWNESLRGPLVVRDPRLGT